MKKLSILFNLFLVPLFLFSQQSWDDMAIPSKVNDIAETTSTLWMATDGGVIAVDKLTNAVSQFTKAKDGLPSNWVEGLAFDNAGNLWIGTYQMNLAKYDGTTWTPITYPSTLPDMTTHSIRFDQNNVAWIGTDKGIVRYDGTNWDLFNASNTNVNFFNDGWDIEIDQQGNVYFVSTFVIKFDGTTWTDISVGTNVLSYGGAHTEILDDGTFVFANFQNIVAFYDTAWTVYDAYNGDFPVGGIEAMTQDENGNICISIKNNGVYKLQNGVWTKQTLSAVQIDENAISTIYTDNDDNLWLANSYEFEKIGNGNVQNININTNPIKSNEINKIYHKGTDVYVLNGEHLTRYQENIGWTDIAVPIIVSPLITSLSNMVITDNDEYWIASNSTELYHWNGQSWNTYSYANSPLPIANINDLEWDEDSKTLWLATGGGVVKYKNQQWTVYDDSNTIFSSFSKPNHIEIGNGVVYAAVDEYIYQFDGTTWTDMTPTNPEFVTSLYLDASENLWIGTWSSGVFKYENNTWTSITELQQYQVVNMIEDENGHFYYGTNDNGLIAFDGTTWTYFTAANSALIHDEINDISLDAYNQLWIGTDRGLNVYHPDGKVSNEEVLSIVDNKFSVFPNPIRQQATIEFTLEQNQTVELGIYNLKGQLVKSIINDEIQMAGEHQINFEKGDLTNGVYFVNLRVNNQIQTIKVLVL